MVSGVHAPGQRAYYASRHPRAGKTICRDGADGGISQMASVVGGSSALPEKENFDHVSRDELVKALRRKGVLWLRITVAILHECVILSQAHHALIRTMLCMQRRRFCSATLQDSRSSKQSLDSLMAQRSRSFGLTETVSKHCAVRVVRLRIARRGG